MVLITVLIHQSNPLEVNTTSLSFMGVERSSKGCLSTFVHSNEASEDCGDYHKHTEV